VSGGSYNYLYRKVIEVAETLSDSNQPDYRKAFAKHLVFIANALHDIEWVDSSDMGNGADKEAIMQCISMQDVLKEAIENAEYAKENLEDILDEARKEFEGK